MKIQIQFSTPSGRVQIQFENTDHADDYYRDLRAKGQFHGQWIQNLTQEAVPPAKKTKIQQDPQ